MSNFFRVYFKPRAFNTPAGNGSADMPFGDFFYFINGTGGAFYRVMYIISVLFLLIGAGIALLNFIMASSGRVKDEAKAKIQRLIWIILGVGASAGIIGTVFSIFTW